MHRCLLGKSVFLSVICLWYVIMKCTAGKKKNKKYMPRLKVWRLKERNVKQKLAEVLADSKNEVSEV